VDLSLATTTVGSTTVLAVGGEVDVYSAPGVRDRINDLLDGGVRALVLDLMRLQFIDSTGLGVLVAAANRTTEAHGSMRLACNQDRILKLLHITGLNAVFEIYSSVDDALAAAPSTPTV
jgi:anti-sigma B factor antagonist